MERSILERTFGLEIEMCNVDRAKINLPYGYSWSKDEHIFNTDGRVSSKYGGEINTPALFVSQENRVTLRNLYKDLVEAGGKIKWSIDTHIHIAAEDLNLEELKRIFYLLYHCYPYIKECFQIADWDELVFNAQPLPTEEHYKRVKEAETLTDLCNVFTNQSAKGFLRLAINIASFFKRGTIEFRCFHATDDFPLVENCIIASYRMFAFAISHTEEEIKAIYSQEDFISRLKLPNSYPPLLTPLIYQGNPYDPKGTFYAKPIGYNANLASSILNQGIDKLTCVGDMGYDYPLALWRKIQVKVYTQDNWTYLLFLLANGKICLEYSDYLEWLQLYNNPSPIRQIALVLYVSKIRKYIKGQSYYTEKLLSSYRCRAIDSIRKFEENAKALLEMFNGIEFIWGNLDDALNDGNTNILFQFGRDKKNIASYNAVANGDTLITNKPVPIDFDGLIERIPPDVTFYMFSDSPYLSNLYKIGLFEYGKELNAGRFLYSNKPSKKVMSKTKREAIEFVHIEEPPSALSVVDAKQLKIVKVKSNYLYELQKRYIKKVDRLSKPTFCYIVMYGHYCLGGFGFNFPNKAYSIDLWQITDFCTNNEIPRLSKLILMLIKSKYVQKLLSRDIGFLCESVYTFVYTNHPVSMKYRGEYNKDKEGSEDGRLMYLAQLGIYKSIDEVLAKYQSGVKNI